MSMKSLQERCTPASCDECRTAPDGRRPLDQAPGLEPAMKLHPPSPSRQGVFTCVGWQVTLCDFMWQVTSRSSEMGSH